MAINLSKYNEAVGKFNKKYGVDFSMAAFKQAETKMNSNSAYKKMFADIYKKAIASYVDEKNNGFSLQEMLIDFDKIMSTYRNDCKAQNINTSLLPLGGWTPDEAIESLKEIPEAFNGSSASFAKDRYLSGKLPIREMMAYTEEAFANGKTPDIGVATVIASYAKGLEEANKSRSFIWKVFHPIRNSAEKKYSKLMQNMISEKCGVVVSEKASSYALAPDAFEKVKAAMASCLKEHNALNSYAEQESGAKAIENVEKEKVVIEELEPKAPVMNEKVEEIKAPSIEARQA